MEELHRWSQLFYKKGWSVIVSYDGKRRAEQFIFSKTQLPIMRPPLMSVGEQQSLLEKYKGGSTWPAPENNEFGPVWTRADNQAYASYIAAQRWFILMNDAGMDRYVGYLNSRSAH